MRKQIFIAIVGATITLPAYATSPQLATACGTLDVRKVMCVRAPCHPLVRLLNAGSPDVYVDVPPVSSVEVYGQLTEKHGKEVCVSGFWQNTELSVISALDYSDAKSAN